ncbi:unnamed protein product [Diamesa serratosioi]
MNAVKRKGRHQQTFVNPFPNVDKKIIAIFTGFCVEVFNESGIKILQDNGSYGQGTKPRQMTYQHNKINTISEVDYQRRLEWKEKFVESGSEETGKKCIVLDQMVDNPFEIAQTQVLFLEEAFFLHYNIDCLDILDLDNNLISTQELWNKFSKLKSNFVECYVAYLYLKSKNWVIKPGIKFGGEFLLYKKSPQQFHASFIVILSTVPTNAVDHQTNQRISETTGKDLIYLEVYYPENIEPKDYLLNIDKFQAAEMMQSRYTVKQQ